MMAHDSFPGIIILFQFIRQNSAHKRFFLKQRAIYIRLLTDLLAHVLALHVLTGYEISWQLSVITLWESELTKTLMT